MPPRTTRSGGPVPQPRCPLQALPRLAVLLGGLLLSCSASAQPAPPPADPAWAGITDTTSFGVRLTAHVAEAERLLDSVRTVDGPRTAENTVLPFKHAEHRLSEASQLAQIALNAHPDSALPRTRMGRPPRRADQCAHRGPCALRRALGSGCSTPCPRLRHVLEQDLEGFRRDGAGLDEASRARVAALRARIAELGTRFEQNIHTDVRSITVLPDSLAGLPPDMVEALAAGSADDASRAVIPVTPDILFPLVVFAEHADVRERAARAFLGRDHPQNAPVIDSLRTLRHELATLNHKVGGHKV